MTNEKIRKEIDEMTNKLRWHDYAGENFDVTNGVMGLDRDVYLSIVKFLDSSTVRKV
jgi:hypothetical protein